MVSDQVQQIIYYSRCVTPMTESEAQKIVQRSAENNKANGVTGMLIYRDGYFLQILEGEVFNVAAIFKRIRDDKRHSDITILYQGPSTIRLFANWSMAYVDSYAFDPNLIAQTVDVYRSAKMTSTNEIIQLFHKFRFQMSA